METTTARPQDVQLELKQILLGEFLAPGEDPSLLDANTRLVSGQVLDPIAVLKLVGILERRFGIEFAAHDIDPLDFDSFGQIADAVTRKSATRTTQPVRTAPEASPVGCWPIGRLAQLFG